MNDQRQTFSDRLIHCEAPTPALGEQFQKELAMMFEKNLSRFGRGMWVFWTVFALAQAVMFGTVAVMSYGDLSLWATAGFAAGVLFALTFGGLSAWIVYAGRVNLKVHPPAMAGLAWGIAVVIGTLTMVSAPDTVVGVRMIVSSLFFLVCGAVFLLASRTEQAELRTKEKLLEIEYRLAELGERLPAAANR